jgi:hypothetical protein
MEKLHLFSITDGPWLPWASLKVSGAPLVQSDGCMGPVSTNPLHLEVLAEAVVQRASMASTSLRPWSLTTASQGWNMAKKNIWDGEHVVNSGVISWKL